MSVDATGFRNIIKWRARQAGSQQALAEQLGISTQYLNDVLNGRRDITQRFAEKFGYLRVVLFEKLTK